MTEWWQWAIFVFLILWNILDIRELRRRVAFLERSRERRMEMDSITLQSIHTRLNRLEDNK
jgi:hypothetical protein